MSLPLAPSGSLPQQEVYEMKAHALAREEVEPDFLGKFSLAKQQLFRIDLGVIARCCQSAVARPFFPGMPTQQKVWRGSQQ